MRFRSRSLCVEVCGKVRVRNEIALHPTQRLAKLGQGAGAFELLWTVCPNLANRMLGAGRWVQKSFSASNQLDSILAIFPRLVLRNSPELAERPLKLLRFSGRVWNFWFSVRVVIVVLIPIFIHCVVCVVTALQVWKRKSSNSTKKPPHLTVWRFFRLGGGWTLVLWLALGWAWGYGHGLSFF